MAKLSRDLVVLRDRIKAAWREQPVFTRTMAEIYLDRVPDDGFIWGMYGDSLAAMGSFAAARTALHTARGLVESDDNKLFVYRMIAELDQKVGDYQSAEALYREVARLRPEQGCWELWLGVCLRRQGRDPEAEACYRKALTLEGHRDEYLLNLGFVLQARGALEEAAQCFSEALTIDPNYKEAADSLADVRQAIAFLQGSAGEGLPTAGGAPSDPDTR